MALIDLYLCLCLLFLTGDHMYRKACRRVCVETTFAFYLLHEAWVTQTTQGEIRSLY